MSKKRKKSSRKGTASPKPTPTLETPDPDHWVWDALEELPPLPAGHQRTLFVAGLPNWALSAIREKGYEILDVRTMDRETDPQAYIDASLQGMAEGTIKKSPERRRNLELLAKTSGLLIKRELTVHASAELKGKSLEMVLERFGTKKTLKPVTAKELRTATKKALIPGYEEKK